MSDIPKEFSQEYYDDKYFADLEGKSFLTPGGVGWKIEHWGYRNPEGEFLGAKEIAKAWKAIFKPVNMLDTGCGRGTFVAYARDEGILAEGFDYSEWAVNNPYPRCKKKWLHNWDATKLWPTPDRSWDLVVALDFLEHIYAENVEFVISEIFRVSRKWIFLQTAITRLGFAASSFSANLPKQKVSGYSLKKGELVPNNLQGVVVAGHVNVQPEEYWLNKLDDDRFLLRRDMAEAFKALVPNEIIANWLKNSIIVLERV